MKAGLKSVLATGRVAAMACVLCAVGLSAMADEPADTVVYGTIRTAEEGNPVAQALAIKGGKYVYVGDEAGVAAFIGDGVTQIIDHRGEGMVMPGCTDGHSHYTMKFGLDNMKSGVMFALEDDKTAILEKLEAAARKAKEIGQKTLFGFGWNFVNIGLKDRPTLEELDAVTYGVSTLVYDQAGHHVLCNSECLKRCGIIDGEENVLIKEIDGGLLELDEDEYPTGYADERVTGYLMRMGGIDCDEVIDDDVAEASIRATQGLLLSMGYTIALEGWSNMLHSNKLYKAANRMDTNGTLKFVFPMTYEVEPWQTNMNEQIDYLVSLKEKYGTDHVLPDYLKLFMDGVVETKTGAMLKPYEDDGTTYKSFWSTNRLADITRTCNAKGLTVHIHAMGDAAVRDVTDAYIQGGDGTHRNCLVHLRNVHTNDYKRFADNNIACTAGMTWHTTSLSQDEFLAKFLAEEYVYHAYPMKSYFDVGVKVSSHSDFPANIPSPQDPFGIMQVAVTGMDPIPLEGDEPFDTNELITVEQAFQALTINGAWQVGLENERGSIRVGKWADFVLTDRDVFTCAVNDIYKTKVVSTWFEGERVYQASPPIVYSQVAATEALEFKVDSRTGERVIDGSAAETLAYSAAGWDKGAAGPATIAYTLNGGASETFAENLTGDGGTNWQPKVNGRFAFTHTPEDAEGPLAATFIVSNLKHTLTIAQTNALTCVVSNETGVITGENGVYAINAGDKIWVVFDTTEDYHFTGDAPAPTVYDVFDGNVMIAESDLPETEKYGDLFFGLVRAAQRYPWNGKVDIIFAVTNLRPTVEYALATAFTVKEDGWTKAQTNDLPTVWYANGLHTNTVNVADASWFGADSLTNAPSKLSVQLLRK